MPYMISKKFSQPKISLVFEFPKIWHTVKPISRIQKHLVMDYLGFSDFQRKNFLKYKFYFMRTPLN